MPAVNSTRTLEEWQKVRKMWGPWVFRDLDSEMERPVIPFTKKNKDKKKKKAKAKQ